MADVTHVDTTGSACRATPPDFRDGGRADGTDRQTEPRARQGSVAANGRSQPLAVMKQQLSHLFVAAVRVALAIAEEDVGPGGNARDLLANHLASTRSVA